MARSERQLEVEEHQGGKRIHFSIIINAVAGKIIDGLLPISNHVQGIADLRLA